jgi:hypothetical protein
MSYNFNTFENYDEPTPMDCSEDFEIQQNFYNPYPEVIYISDDEVKDNKAKQKNKIQAQNKVIVKKSYRKKTIPLPVRTKVWNTYVGETKGKAKCMCCGDVDITPFRFECGHLKSEYNNGDISIENLRPICSGCNKSMGKINMDEYMKKNKLKFPLNWLGNKSK